MGMGLLTFDLYCQLARSGKFRGFTSVVELGAQEIHTDLRALSAFVQALGLPWDEKETIPYRPSGKQEGRHMSGKFVYDKLGFKRYVCIDTDDLFDALPFDLNEDLAAKYGFTEQFDLVTNFGTSEHIINQFAVFKSIHNLCKPGGLMFHVVPMQGYNNHCFFNYHPLFFVTLAKANGYRIEGIWISDTDVV